MAHPLGELSTEAFLSDWWQRKPCLIRGAFPDFEPPIDGDDLAGLACEPLAEARIVRGPDDAGAWTLEHGPFDEAAFTEPGERNWALLVQDVEKHFPPLAEMLGCFDFLPGWRLDDIMVSFAAPGGSVGPHVDQYDVFLLQAAGRRRWAIAHEFDPARRDDVPLDMLAAFEAEEDWVLEPGDMLYLPPGVAHHGVAEVACLTYSIGLRAPSAADLLMALGEALADAPDEGGRYTDPPLGDTARPGEIDAPALQRFGELASAALADRPALNDFFGRFINQYRQSHGAAPPPRPVDGRALQALLDDSTVFHRNPWSRFNWIERSGSARLFAGGEAVTCSVALAESLCRQSIELPAEIGAGDAETLRALLNAGHLVAETSE